MKAIVAILGISLVLSLPTISEAKRPNPAIDNTVILCHGPWHMTVCPTSLTMCIGEYGEVKAWITPSYANDEFTFPKKIKDGFGEVIAIVAPAPNQTVTIEKDTIKITGKIAIVEIFGERPGTGTMTVSGYSPCSGERFSKNVSVTLLPVKFFSLLPFHEGPVTLRREENEESLVILEAGNTPEEDPGILWVGIAEIPTTCKGKGILQITQNIKADVRIIFKDHSELRKTTGGYVLDTFDPAESDIIPVPSEEDLYYISFGDIPKVVVPLSWEEEGKVWRVIAKEKFEVFFMWKPFWGRRMPLGLGRWNWTGRAESEEGTLQLNEKVSEVPGAKNGFSTKRLPKTEPVFPFDFPWKPKGRKDGIAYKIDEDP